VRHATLRAGLPVLALLALAGCSGGSAADSEAVVSSGDASACPGEVLDVVVSVGAWSDVVRRLGGDCATVTTIAPDTEAPAEVVPADRAAFDAADLVVLNGARLDGWAGDAVAAAGDPVVVSAAEAAGADDRGSEPHLWFDPAVVPEVARAVTHELARLSPDAAPYFAAQHTAWTTELQPWLESVAALEAGADGRTFAATGAEFGRLAAAVGLTDVTPGDPAELEAAVRDGAVDVLVQVGDELPDRLAEAADDAEVPVVAISEAPAEDASFVEWQLAQLGALADALAEGR
jgi:zinc/manganese transport system substrate-binding protein